MVKKLFIKDFKNIKSTAFQDLLKTSAGVAANQKIEQFILFNALKNGISSYPGNPTKALAKTFGILAANPSISKSERLQIKQAFQNKGFFVPNYLINENNKTQSRSMQLKNESGNNNVDINKVYANRETNIRHSRPMQQSYETKLQNVVKIPGKPKSN